MKKLVLGAFTLIFLFCGTSALATTLGFNDIDGILAEDQNFIDNLLVGVALNATTGNVEFTFTNDNDDLSFIAAIYFDFDDIGLIASGSYDGGVGDVSFSDYTHPRNGYMNVPGGQEIGFNSDYSARADNLGSGRSGVDYGDSAVFAFDILGEFGFDDVIAAIISEDLRIAIDVQGIGVNGDDSDHFVNNTTPVPEPALMLLLGVGLIGIAGLGEKLLEKMN